VVTLALYVLLALGLMLGLFMLAVRVLPSGEQIAPPVRDEPIWTLPEELEVTAKDVAEVRLPVALRGYRFAETDVLLDRLSEEIKRRDALIEQLSGGRAVVPPPVMTSYGELGDFATDMDDEDEAPEIVLVAPGAAGAPDEAQAAGWVPPQLDETTESYWPAAALPPLPAPAPPVAPKRRWWQRTPRPKPAFEGVVVPVDASHVPPPWVPQDVVHPQDVHAQDEPTVQPPAWWRVAGARTEQPVVSEPPAWDLVLPTPNDVPAQPEVDDASSAVPVTIDDDSLTTELPVVVDELPMAELGATPEELAGEVALVAEPTDQAAAEETVDVPAEEVPSEEVPSEEVPSEEVPTGESAPALPVWGVIAPDPVPEPAGDAAQQEAAASWWGRPPVPPPTVSAPASPPAEQPAAAAGGGWWTPAPGAVPSVPPPTPPPPFGFVPDLPDDEPAQVAQVVRKRWWRRAKVQSDVSVPVGEDAPVPFDEDTTAAPAEDSATDEAAAQTAVEQPPTDAVAEDASADEAAADEAAVNEAAVNEASVDAAPVAEAAAQAQVVEAVVEGPAAAEASSEQPTAEVAAEEAAPVRRVGRRRRAPGTPPPA
jgi:hypothetical protein